MTKATKHEHRWEPYADPDDGEFCACGAERAPDGEPWPEQYPNG